MELISKVKENLEIMSSSSEEEEEEKPVSIKPSKVEIEDFEEDQFQQEPEKPLMDHEINIDDPSLAIDDEAENKEFSETISKVYCEQFDQERASIKLTNRQKFGISKKEVTPKVARKPKFKADGSMSPKRANLTLVPQVKTQSLQKGSDPRNLMLNKKPKTNEYVPLFERPIKGSQLDKSSDTSRRVPKNIKSINI